MASVVAPENCPHPSVHGNPFRYCPYCSWIEAHLTTEEIIQRAIEQWAVLAFAASTAEYPSLAHYIAASIKENR
jgi:hypothetical protein